MAGLLLLALVPRALAAQTQRNDQREAPEVKQLILDGVHGVDRDQLAGALATKPSQCKSVLLQIFFCWYSHSPLFFQRNYLDYSEYQRDVLRIEIFYWERGWRDVSVDTAVTKNGTGVTAAFHVHENQPTIIARQTVLYDSTLLDQKRIKRTVLTRAGQPIDLTLLDTTRANLQAEMWNKGYADATVDTSLIVDTLTKRADLTITVIPNRRTTVGPITITGNQKVSAQTIANSLTLRPGEIFRRNDVLQSQRNLYESNLFRLATVTVPPVADTVKPVEITVAEAPLHDAMIGWGFTSIDFLQLQGRYTAYNLFGGARRLDINGTVANLLAPQLNGKLFFQNVTRDVTAQGKDATLFLQPTWQASIDFRQPAFLQRPQNAVGVGAFGHRQAVPAVFVDRGYGGTATYTRTHAERIASSVTYRFEITRVEGSDVFFCATYGVCTTRTINTLRTHQTLSPVAYNFLGDRSDDPFDPTKGFRAQAQAEHASRFTASDYQYNRATGDYAVYHRMNGRGLRASVLAGHLRLGLLRPLRGSEIHPQKLFFAGGARSVRGFGESQLGPRVLTVPPEDLARIGCDVTDPVAVQSCDPNLPDSAGHPLPDSRFTPRPLGGTSVAEASVEYRFPVFKELGAAVFVDGGFVGDAAATSRNVLRGLTSGTWAVTPGFGVRYRSPIGSIRVDVGINPSRVERLPVVTEVDIDGEHTIVPLRTERRYSPTQGAGGLQAVLRRLQLHLAIGQAY